MLVEPAVFRASVANPRQRKEVRLSTRIPSASNVYVGVAVQEYQAVLEALYARLDAVDWNSMPHPAIQHRMILHH